MIIFNVEKIFSKNPGRQGYLTIDNYSFEDLYDYAGCDGVIDLNGFLDETISYERILEMIDSIPDNVDVFLIDTHY